MREGDPLVGGVDEFFEIGVGDDFLRQVAPPVPAMRIKAVSHPAARIRRARRGISETGILPGLRDQPLARRPAAAAARAKRSTASPTGMRATRGARCIDDQSRRGRASWSR